MSKNGLKKCSLFQYGFLALPLAFAGLPLYIHAPDFYTRELGANITILGYILLGIRLFDAVQDPIIGYISDRIAQARFIFMLIGAVTLTIGMGGVFYGPQLSVQPLLWFAVTMVFATSGFSILAINLQMIGGFWSDNKNERTTISAWREAFSLLGLLVASILPTMLAYNMPADRSYEILFFVFVAIIILAIILFSGFMLGLDDNHVITKKSDKKHFALFQILKGPNKLFFTSCFTTHLAASLPGILVLFFIRDYLQAGHLAGVFLALYFISGAIFMPLWNKIANKTNKNKAWLISMFLAVATFIGAYFLQSGDVIAYGIICVLSGTALGADLALPPAIMADRISQQGKEEQATQFFSILALIPKTAIALISALGFIALGKMGFQAGAENSGLALNGLITLYALIPCILKIISAGLLGLMMKREA